MTSPFLAPGSHVGRFRIVEQLGAGGMGVVYAAHEETLDRRVALKVISPNFAEDPDFRVRFGQEARALASLDSPYVVQVFAHGEEDGHVYIATQLVPDGDLGQLLKRSGPPPLGRAVQLVEQVASGLADAHAAGLVHRDIKPANVLVRRRGDSLHAYLGDFGIARRIDVEVTRAGTMAAGTPSYMAPELHQGSDATPSSDLYALGCLLWITLTGGPPFPGAQPLEVINGHLHGTIPQLVGDSRLVEVVNRSLRIAMAKQPGHRYPSATALREDLREAAQLVRDPAFAVPARRAYAGPASSPIWTAAMGSVPSTPSRPDLPPHSPYGPPPVRSSPAGPSPRPRRRRALWAGVAAACVLAIGAGLTVALVTADDGGTSEAGSGGGGTGSGGTGGGEDVFAEQSAQEISVAAEKEMKVLDSVHVDGFVSDPSTSTNTNIDMTVTSAGDCDGSIALNGVGADIRSIDGQTWLRGDTAFWTLQLGDELGALVADQVADRWVLGDDESAASFEEICDLDRLLEDASGNEDELRVDGTDDLDGEPVVRVVSPETTGDETSSISIAEPHYVLRIEGGAAGRIDFSEFDEPFEVTAPPAGEVVDLGELGG